AGDEWHAVTGFPDIALHAPPIGVGFVLENLNLLGKPVGAVVTGENKQRVVRLLDKIAVRASLALALEFLGWHPGMVDGGERKIKKERLVFLLFANELNRL